jgi:hypothetical protein
MAQINKKPDYLNRDFSSIRAELEQLLRIYYPEQFKDFNVVSPGMAMIDLLAYTSDILSYYTDKRFNQLFLDGVDEIDGAFRLAKTLGFKPQGKNPAISLASISLNVPVLGDGPDPDYLPIIRSGLQLVGGGEIFETIYDIDFTSDFSEEFIKNRTIEPVFDANQNIINYLITKYEKIIGGSTQTFSIIITDEIASTPFFKLNLTENNVLDIESVIVKSGTNIPGTPTYSEFFDFNLRYFEVESLAQDKVFLDTGNSFDGIKEGSYVVVDKRFTKDFNPNGSCTLTFGGGSINSNPYQQYLNSIKITGNQVSFEQFVDNSALGYKLPPNSTLYVRYRTGGGALSNVATGVLSQVSNANLVVNGSDPNLLQQVQASLRGQNITPALGGADVLSVNELKQYIGANYSAQNRCVTLDDYISRAYQIPGKYGRPFRIHGEVNDNKIIMYILSLNADGKIALTSTNIIKNNLAAFLSNYRMVNDFIEINDAFVINFGIDVSLLVNSSYNPSEVKAEAISLLKDYFNINNWQINQRIYISKIVDLLVEIPGVINVIDIKFKNITGAGYSSITSNQADGATIITPGSTIVTKQMTPINNEILSNQKTILELRYPDSDISINTVLFTNNFNSF